MARTLSIYLMSVLFLFSCGEGKEKELKLKEFEKRYNEITEISPEEANLQFIEICENADETSPFSKYTPEMIKSQFSTNYRLESDELSKLIVDILVYKKIIPDKEISPDQLKNIVKKLNEKEDKFNEVVFKSFDLIVEYKTKELSQ